MAKDRSGSARRQVSHEALILCAPAFAILAVLFLYPVANLVGASFGTGAKALANYARIVEQPTYLLVLNRTLLLSGATAALCLVLGYPIAYRLATASPRARAVLLGIILVPFWTNLLVRCYGWMVVLNPRGVLNTVLLDSGLIAEPFDLVHNTTGVLIGMVQIMLPYMIFPLAAVMSRIDERLLVAARSLGASPVDVFLRVYFPLTLPGVMSGVLLVFTISLGFFVIPAVLGGPRDIFLAQLIEFNINQVLDWGMAAALSTVLLVVTLALIWIADRWFGLGAIWGLK